MYYVSKYPGFQNFKPRYVLARRYILKSKETNKVELSTNKIQLLQKYQLLNCFVKNLRKTTEF